MDASVSSSILTAPTPKVLFFRTSPSSKPTLNFRSKSKGYLLIGNQSLKTRRVAAINDVSAATDAVPVDLTWQIVVGAIAGVTPFVVAGIEFSKRIIAQRRCEVCGGSGLVQKNEYYVRCPGCGGFLPWQSWKRFFSG
ncbi:uncharacterized protein LOC107435503 [Ziziphus jujuba]|uniref:Uncharacterized protein LOC107435503 n=1 Tax=Ziziphus jujuba TaxID=326968 RepID=A0A6P4BTG5_ZIZJJ|nr:uncharacterized protein LOC107435503 [Ziziphus jujuba]